MFWIRVTLILDPRLIVPDNYSCAILTYLIPQIFYMDFSIVFINRVLEIFRDKLFR